LLILIGLLTASFVVFLWALAASYFLFKRVEAKVDKIVEELLPALREAQKALQEATATLQNTHTLTDNLKVKIDTFDRTVRTVRQLPEQAARAAGSLLGLTLRLGGRWLVELASSIVKSLQPAHRDHRSPALQVAPNPEEGGDHKHEQPRGT
ncbi:MAG: hypothetical protein ABIN58_12580, partial [candidate division WOR-3 bacterium]